MSDALVRWLLTYLLHSTVLLGAAMLVCAALARRRLALQEALLRAALIGGFLTACLQLGLELRPLGGTLVVPRTNLRANVAETSIDDGRTFSISSARFHAHLEPAPTWSKSTLAQRTSAWTTEARNVWPRILLALWVGSAMLAFIRLAVSAGRLRSLLRDRRPLAESESALDARMVAAILGLRRSVRLSAAQRLTVPLATGLLRAEVCLPQRVLADLPANERIALCAHELAHVARSDPAWRRFVRIVEALVPLQPLNGRARRRLEELAECLSDDLAVCASAQPLGLARSLIEVASWTRAGRAELPATAACAFRSRSRLAYRVERIMDSVRRLERPRRLLLPLVIASVLTTALITPIVVFGTADSEPTPKKDTLAPKPSEDPTPENAPQPRSEALPMPQPSQQTNASRDMERDIERLTARIEERVRERRMDMTRIEAAIEALTSRIGPKSEELERLGQELENATRELVAAVTDHATQGIQAGRSRGDMTKYTRRIAELQRRIREVASQIRPSEKEIRSIQKEAQTLAELARPTEEELRELRRLSEEIARKATLNADETRRMIREAMEQARESMRLVEEEKRRMEERLKQEQETLLRRSAQERQADARRLAREEEEARREHERRSEERVRQERQAYEEAQRRAREEAQRVAE